MTIWTIKLMWKLLSLSSSANIKTSALKKLHVYIPILVPLMPTMTFIQTCPGEYTWPKGMTLSKPQVSQASCWPLIDREFPGLWWLGCNKYSGSSPESLPGSGCRSPLYALWLEVIAHLCNTLFSPPLITDLVNTSCLHSDFACGPHRIDGISAHLVGTNIWY